MKKILMSITLVCVSFTFVGCMNSGKIVPAEEKPNARFQQTGNVYTIEGYTWSEYVDTETNNLYLCGRGNSSSGITPLYDENGNIAKYKE